MAERIYRKRARYGRFDFILRGVDDLTDIDAARLAI